MDLPPSTPAKAETTGIKGALLWPAAGLLLTVPTLILQWPSASYLVEMLESLLYIPDFASTSEGRKLLLQPFIELLYLSAILVTPVAIFLFFARSRLARPVVIGWLLVGIVIAVASLGQETSLLGAHQSYIWNPNIPILEFMNHIFTWPGLIVLPVVRVPVDIYASYKYIYVQIAALAIWLIYFTFSSRVANTFRK